MYFHLRGYRLIILCLQGDLTAPSYSLCGPLESLRDGQGGLGVGGGVGALKQGSRDTSEPLSDLHTSLSQARAQCAADLEVSVEQI